MEIQDIGRFFAEQRAASNNLLQLAQDVAGPSFDDTVMSVVERFIEVDHFSAFVNTLDQMAGFIAAGSHRRDGVSSALSHAYAERFCRADPVAHAIARSPGDQELIVQCRPASDILDPAYRRECYDKPGVMERLTISSYEQGRWHTLNLYRARRSRPFDASDMMPALRAAACILPVLPLRTCALAAGTAEGRPRDRRARLASLASSLEQFSVRLPRREVEVCARALIGMTVEGTALDLGIAITSVATYRKRAYQRLGISSLNELFAILH